MCTREYRVLLPPTPHYAQYGKRWASTLWQYCSLVISMSCCFFNDVQGELKLIFKQKQNGLIDEKIGFTIHVFFFPF